MLRMGKLTDYATVVLASLAQEPARHRAAAELAERTRLSRPTVSKVLKGLQRAGMVISSRGAQGGYRLSRDPEQITAAQILDDAVAGRRPDDADEAVRRHLNSVIKTLRAVGDGMPGAAPGIPETNPNRWSARSVIHSD